jgi:hypothetical protein
MFRPAVLLAVAAAVLLSLLLGLYVGWRYQPEPALAVASSTPGEPLKLRLELHLRSQRP